MSKKIYPDKLEIIASLKSEEEAEALRKKLVSQVNKLQKEYPLNKNTPGNYGKADLPKKWKDEYKEDTKIIEELAEKVRGLGATVGDFVVPEVKEEITTTTTTLFIVKEIKVNIHDKYRKYIYQVESGYLRGLEYGEAMDILRWMEKKVGHNIPINYSCSSCMIDLVKRFAAMEKK